MRYVESQVIGNLRTYTKGDATNTCNNNYFKMDFSVVINDKNNSSTPNELKLLNEVYIYPTPYLRDYKSLFK